MCAQGPSRLVSLVRSGICGPNAWLPRHIAGIPQPSTLRPPVTTLLAQPAPVASGSLSKIAHSGRKCSKNDTGPLRTERGGGGRSPITQVAQGVGLLTRLRLWNQPLNFRLETYRGPKPAAGKRAVRLAPRAAVTRRGQQIGLDCASSGRLFGACSHPIVVADIGFLTLKSQRRLAPPP
jgi:hypothetical protein